MPHSIRSYLLRYSDNELRAILNMPNRVPEAYTLARKILKNRQALRSLYSVHQLNQMPTADLKQALNALLESDDLVGIEVIVRNILSILERREKQ